MNTTSSSPSQGQDAAAPRAGQILAGLVVAGIVVSFAVFSLAIAAVLALALGAGLVWQWGRTLVAGNAEDAPRNKLTRGRFDAYQEARRAALARDEAAFDAHVARQRAAADAARFAQFRSGQSPN